MNPLPAEAVVLPESPEELERMEGQLLGQVDVVTFLKHHFAPGIYVREIWMPAGSIILGHEHKNDHLNIVVSGKCLVRAEGQLRQITAGPAPVTFRSGAGVRKALYIIEDTTWMTVHENPDDSQDIPLLEDRYTRKSETYKQHELAVIRGDFRRVLDRTP